jgi:hypothetical protein
MNFSENGKLTFNEICFAGYGLRVKPNSNSEGYDSYTHLDVANKWVMVLDGLPPHITDTSVINYFSNPTQKASLARNLGAQGIIFVNSENNDTTKQIASNVDHSLTIKSFVLSRETASLLFNSNGRKLSTEIEKFNNSEPVLGFTLKNFRVNGDIKIKKERGECHNTLGWLRSGKKNNDILVKSMFMFGNPEDNEDIIKDTINYSMKLSNHLVQYSVFTPYPGTPIFSHYEDKIIEKRYDKFNQYNLTFKHKNLDNKKIKTLKNYGYKKFYLRLKNLPIIIKSGLSFFK